MVRGSLLLLPVLILACAGPASTIDTAGARDGGGAAADSAGGAAADSAGGAAADSAGGADTGSERGSGSACAAPVPSPSFASRKIATVDLVLGLPTVRMAADGTARVFYLGGSPIDQQVIMGADPATGAARALSGHGGSFTPPRFEATAGGQLRGAYVAGDVTVRSLEWSGDLDEDAADLPVTAEPALPHPLAVALDGRGGLAIAALYDHQIRLATRHRDGWTTETVASKLLLSGVALAVAVDARDEPVVVAIPEQTFSHDPELDELSPGVTIFSRGGDEWSRATVDSLASARRPRALRRPDGDVAIFFLDPSRRPWALATAVRRNGDWRADVPLLDDAGRALVIEEAFDVAYGPDGVLHVAYTRPDGHLGYARFDGCRWTEVLVDAARGGGDPAIALDAEGRPHFAYSTAIASGGDGAPADLTEVWYASARP